MDTTNQNLGACTDNFNLVDKEKTSPRVLEALNKWYWENEEQPVLRSVHQFKEHTKEEIEEIFKKEHANWSPGKLDHPDFDHIKLTNPQDIAEFWENFAISCPDDHNAWEAAEYWKKNAEEHRRRDEELERKVNESVCRSGILKDILCMAGLLNAEDIKDFEDCEIDTTRGDIDILDKVRESVEFPDRMDLCFVDNRLCVNGAVTRITEEAVYAAYFGLHTLLNHRKAVDIVAGIVKNKLKRLF